MSKSIFTAPHFNDEAAAYAYVEARLWKDGRSCPHCGVIDRSGKLQGKSNRPGLWKCYACRKPFTVKIGTIFEASHIPMRDWLTAIHLICSSKKGISSNQLHRTLGITLKSAWFLSHRIRLAMDGKLDDAAPMGGLGAIVEVDETYVGKQDHVPHRVKGYWTKNTVLSLVTRGGHVRSFHVAGHATADLAPYMNAHINKHSVLVTDEGAWYKETGKGFLAHHTVNHGDKEWKRGYAHTNTVEGFFSVFKKGMRGIYQHCSEKHLHRYLAEFDFRYSNRVRVDVNDVERADRALFGVIGKRLTYQTAARG